MSKCQCQCQCYRNLKQINMSCEHPVAAPDHKFCVYYKKCQTTKITIQNMLKINQIFNLRSHQDMFVF